MYLSKSLKSKVVKFLQEFNINIRGGLRMNVLSHQFRMFLRVLKTVRHSYRAWPVIVLQTQLVSQLVKSLFEHNFIIMDDNIVHRGHSALIHELRNHVEVVDFV